MSTPHDDEARKQLMTPAALADNGGNLADIQREAAALHASQQQDFARFRAEMAAETARMRDALAAFLPAETPPHDATETAPPMPTPIPAETVTDTTTAAEPHATSRRALLKWGGLGAAATLAAAGGASFAMPTAHASDGGTLILGSSGGTAEHTTEISYDGGEASPTVFRVATGATNSTAIEANAGGGTTATTSGVSGSGGTNGRGIRGAANGSTGFGVWGATASGYGVVGESGSGIDLAANGTGRILQAQSGSAGPPASGSYFAGEQICDAFGNLYICVTSGSPGVWQKVVGKPVGYRSGAISFLPTPIRVYDSRPSNNPLVGNGVRNVQITGVNIGAVQVPSGASGCIGNLTVVRPTTGGYLVIYPQGSSTPSSSTVNYSPFETIPNSFWVGLSGGGQVTIHAFQRGDCHFIVDITGYIS